MEETEGVAWKQNKTEEEEEEDEEEKLMSQSRDSQLGRPALNDR